MAEPVSALEVVLGVVLGGLVLLLVRHYSTGWRGATKSGARLPKGSFGWPIIGETLHFARDPLDYVQSHVKRHGSIFKTSLMLMPMIVGTTPEFAKFLLGNSNLFVSGWPASIAEIVGPKAFAHKHGPEHIAVKRILQKPLLPESLKSKTETLESIILRNLASWAQTGTIIARDAAQKITLDTGMLLLLGFTDIGSTPEGKEALQNLSILNRALTSPPVNIPGTAFNKGLKAKTALRKYFKGLLEGRKTMKNTQSDILGVLSAAQEDPQARAEVKDLDDETISDNLVMVWFGAYDTTSTTLTWVLKFINDNPDVFRKLQAEQLEIFEGRDVSGDEPRVTWEDTRKMVYATKFFQEVQRTLSISPFVMKKAVQDVEYEGYLIPKGWGVSLSVNFIHADPNVHLDPTSFNPDRFDATPQPFTYIPFSVGPHMCPGKEMAKLIALLFIHHLTTTYTFESLEPDKGIEYTCMPTPVGGYPISVRRRN